MRSTLNDDDWHCARGVKRTARSKRDSGAVRIYRYRGLLCLMGTALGLREGSKEE